MVLTLQHSGVVQLCWLSKGVYRASWKITERLSEHRRAVKSADFNYIVEHGLQAIWWSVRKSILFGTHIRLVHKAFSI